MSRIRGLSVLLALVSFLVTAGGEGTYRAAVLEFAQFADASLPAEDILYVNLAAYKKAAEVARKNDVDIIVYPESGLLPFVKPTNGREWLGKIIEDIPDPKQEKANPCEEDRFNDRPILYKLSCMAKKNQMYLVANVADKKNCDHCKSTNCTDCPEDGFYFFNTNVVFDRRGTLVAKYWKRHLYFEPEMNTPPETFETDHAYFETDFGNFTTTICFDLMFDEPLKAVEKPGVWNVAYPTYWFDHMPLMYFATPYQQAWAMLTRVNLLAANGHHGSTGSLGSGIYSSSRGALIYTHNPDGEGKLLISNVPRNPRIYSANTIPLNAKRYAIRKGEFVEENGEEKSAFEDKCGLEFFEKEPEDHDYRCGSTYVGHYKFVKLEKTSDSIEACQGGFCCSLTYDADSMDESYYLGSTGLELNFYDTNYFGIQSCFLARCEAHGGEPCTNYILKAKSVFRRAELKGNFSTEYVFPFAIDSEIELTDRKLWYFHKKSAIMYQNPDEDSNLIFLGLYGRLFHLDKTIIHHVGSAYRTLLSLRLIILAVFWIFFANMAQRI